MPCSDLDELHLQICKLVRIEALFVLSVHSSAFLSTFPLQQWLFTWWKKHMFNKMVSFDNNQKYRASVSRFFLSPFIRFSCQAAFLMRLRVLWILHFFSYSFYWFADFLCLQCIQLEWMFYGIQLTVLQKVAYCFRAKRVHQKLH